MENVPEEVLVRLDKLAETIGTSVSGLFDSLYADAVRFGWAQVVFGGGMILTAILIVSMIALIVYHLTKNLTTQTMNDYEVSPKQGWQLGLYIPTFIFFVVFFSLGVSYIADGIETLSQPTRYAVQSLSGIFK